MTFLMVCSLMAQVSAPYNNTPIPWKSTPLLRLIGTVLHNVWRDVCTILHAHIQSCVYMYISKRILECALTHRVSQSVSQSVSHTHIHTHTCTHEHMHACTRTNINKILIFHPQKFKIAAQVSGFKFYLLYTGWLKYMAHVTHNVTCLVCYCGYLTL